MQRDPRTRGYDSMVADGDVDEVSVEVCAECAGLEALILQGVAHGCRITLLASLNTQCSCTPLRWTALVTQAERVCAMGSGHTQDEAILEALRTLGVVT